MRKAWDWVSPSSSGWPGSWRHPCCLQSHPGRGSLFAFGLERAREVATPRVHLAPRSSDSRNLAGTLVVVIDDEELILDAAQSLPRAVGMHGHHRGVGQDRPAKGWRAARVHRMY